MPTETPSTYPANSDELEAFDAANSSQSATGAAIADSSTDAENNRNGDRYTPQKVQIAHRPTAFQWFYDLPVADKQLIGLFASKAISAIGFIGVSLWLLSLMSHRQLADQSVSELSATVRNLSDAVGGTIASNDEILRAAERYAESSGFSDRIIIQEDIQPVLRAAMRAERLDYVALVGTDFKVIASGGADRSGDSFNPDELVSSALTAGKSKRATSLLSLEALQQVGVSIASNAESAALVRYSVTPIFASDNLDSEAVARGEVIGALVTGDRIDSESPLVTDALTQFPTGFSALYRRDPEDGLTLIGSSSGADMVAVESATEDDNLRFLTQALEAAPAVISQQLQRSDGAGAAFQGNRYTVAATAIVNRNNEPIGVVVRGLSEAGIGQRLRQVIWLQLGVAVLALLTDVIIARLLGRAIVRPVRNLQAATKKFALGDRTARADIFAKDEVGRVATAFNDLAESVSSSESYLRFQSETQTKSAQRSHLLSELTSQVRQAVDMSAILDTAVVRARELLAVDRVIVYRFAAGYGGGDVIAESVGKGWERAKGEHLEDPMLPDSVGRFMTGQISYIEDIETADLTDCHCRLLRSLEVKANMVSPIIVGEDLVGLLCAHQCSHPRRWQTEEIGMMQQISTQIGYALAQSRLLQNQEQAVKQEQQLTHLVTQIRETSDREKIFRIVTREVKSTIGSNRVIIYTFDREWKGTIVAEAVDPQWPQTIGSEIADPCFADSYVEQYRTGRVKATADIYQAGLTACHLGQLEPFKVRANLVAPIVVEDRLLGLLIAHECEGPRNWSELTIGFIRRAATQLGYALEQAEATVQKEQALAQTEALSEERLQRQELLQSQLLNLLSDVEAAADGNLTVRADVSAGEIGTVADFFNVIVENLRQIVTQVKQSAQQVNASLGENESAIRTLADEALQQAEQTTLTLHSIGTMTTSIQQVAQQAQSAAAVAKSASETATAGEEAMDLTVSNIMALRQTVGQTAKKVKRLGESSQQITKAVMLINQISQQTNLLAINAGIEAARAGEDGQGFAAVAEEVGELATRSATATEEIERIVETIQRETLDVVEAIEKSTTQVVEGTRRVEDAKASLSQILVGSQKMDELARMISEATRSQVETSATVSQLMAEIAQLSQRTSASSRQASEALQQTVAISQNLQSQVATFVVIEE